MAANSGPNGKTITAAITTAADISTHSSVRRGRWTRAKNMTTCNGVHAAGHGEKPTILRGVGIFWLEQHPRCRHRQYHRDQEEQAGQRGKHPEDDQSDAVASRGGSAIPSDDLVLISGSLFRALRPAANRAFHSHLAGPGDSRASELIPNG
jgi:hypothetical protein